MFPRCSLLVLLISCRWQWASLLIGAPTVCLAYEEEYDNHPEAREPDNYHPPEDYHWDENHYDESQDTKQEPDGYDENSYENKPEEGWQDHDQQQEQIEYENIEAFLNEEMEHNPDELENTETMEIEETQQDTEVVPPEDLYQGQQDYHYEEQPEDGPPGVDYSWPIHYFRNRHPMPDEQGRRARRYFKFLQGCEQHYSVEACRTSDAERRMMNLRQPSVLMNYTAAGYAKVEAPASVFAMLKQFYAQNLDRQVRETWPPGNIYANHWASAVKLLPIAGLPLTEGSTSVQPSLSQPQRRDIIAQVQPILEAWCKMPLLPTSLYGIRTYHKGSILVPHVDRLPLVISAIINVAQSGVREDWPLEIIDHSGNAVNLTMKPGDMVLYEGASVIHGRPYPLHGQSYSNLFLHFEPVGFSERHHNSPEEKRRRKDPKTLFEEALAKQRKPPVATKESDRSGKLPHYVPEKHEEQWEQRFVYIKRKAKPKLDAKNDKDKTKGENDDDEPDERLFHNLAAKGMLQRMKEMLMDDPTLIAKADKNGWLALHEAARAGETQVVEYLCGLMTQAEINRRTNSGRGATPLWWALHMFNEEHPTVRALLKHGAKSVGPNSP